MKKSRILHIGKYYPPEPGGIEEVEKHLCEGLAGKYPEYDITVLCANNSMRTVVETINGVKITRAGSLGRLSSVPLSLVFPLHFISEEYDMIHLHLPNPYFSVFPLLSQKPVVVSYHADIVRQKLGRRLLSPLIRGVLDKASSIVVSSSNNIDVSSVLPEFRNKCEIVPYGLNTARFAEYADQEKISEIRKRHGDFVLSVGRLVGYKGFSHLIEAMKNIEDKKLIVIGEGPLREELLHQAAELGISDRVILEGRVPSEDLPAYYRACSMFVLPSITIAEAFGMVMVEAMASGKPVISTRLGSGVDFVNANGRTGLVVEPSSARALSDAITTLYNNDDMREKMGVEAEKRAETEFSSKIMVSRYHMIYRRLLGE